MTRSSAYADLGGGMPEEPAYGPATRSPRIRPGENGHWHTFDSGSGWCPCGVRDTGEIAQGSPAWRAQIERSRKSHDTTDSQS